MKVRLIPLTVVLGVGAACAGGAGSRGRESKPGQRRRRPGALPGTSPEPREQLL